MRLVIQRVRSASVTIEEQIHAQIGRGLMVLVGVGDGDSESDADYAAEKTVGLRIFPDDDGKMNRSITDIGAEILAISQFTLLGDCRKGRRPAFTAAAKPALAIPLYERYCESIRARGIPVRTGIFAADMQVSLVNDGPVTLLIDSRKEF